MVSEACHRDEGMTLGLRVLYSILFAFAERRWNLYHQSKGKEVIDAHEESNSELDELAEALHFEEGFVQSSDGEVEHEAVAALWKRDLQFDDSEDEHHLDQLFEIWEESNLTPGVFLHQWNP
jgi:hypothetical protein